MNATPIPIIIGPTAIGKTSYAIDLALKTDSEIISADSMQVYRHMDIGTAKPTKQEQQQVKHHLIDIINPAEEWNLNIFLKTIRNLLITGKKYIIAGGTGLYIRALIYNFQTPDIETNPKYREILKNRIKEEGPYYLYNELKKIDPESTEKITPNDEYRIIRALEVYKQTGQPFSSLQSQDKSYAENFRLLCLNTDREKMYNRINKRVDLMIEAGLIHEVQTLLNMGYSRELSSLKALGYKEIIAYLDKKLSLEDSIEIIKRKTRNFAKRQLTWYRSFPDVEWISV